MQSSDLASRLPFRGAWKTLLSMAECQIHTCQNLQLTKA